MKSEHEIRKRLAQATDPSNTSEISRVWASALGWVLKVDCLVCSHASRKDIEADLRADRCTPAYLEERYGWADGTVQTHLDLHMEFSKEEAELVEEGRRRSINTLDTAEDIVGRVMGWLDELEERKAHEGMSSEWVQDASNLVGRCTTALKLVGQLKKEIGVESQLLLAQNQVDHVMIALVDILSDQPALLEEVHDRMETVIDVDFDVVT